MKEMEEKNEAVWGVFFAKNADLGFNPAPADASRPGWALPTCRCRPGMNPREETNSTKLMRGGGGLRSGRCEVKIGRCLFPEGLRH